MDNVTQLLQAAGRGDSDAAAALMATVYEDLRCLAAAKMRREPAGQTLQPTALVHEAYLRLMGPEGRVGFDNRAHFYAAAGEAMRRILVERARRQRQVKRGAGRQRQPLTEAMAAAPAPGVDALDLLTLDELLKKLESLDQRLASLIKLRYFVGLSVEETADALGVSHRTVNRDWLVARAWLRREMATDRFQPDGA